MTATIEAPTTDLGPDDVREMNAELPAYLGTFFVHRPADSRWRTPASTTLHVSAYSVLAADLVDRYGRPDSGVEAVRCMGYTIAAGVDGTWAALDSCNRPWRTFETAAEALSAILSLAERQALNP